MRIFFKLISAIILLSACVLQLGAAERFITFHPEGTVITLAASPEDEFAILYDPTEHAGVKIALGNLQNDFLKVTDIAPRLVETESEKVRIIVGTWDKSPAIRRLARNGAFDPSGLKNKNEKFIITTAAITIGNEKQKALVIAGSDKRGTIYGIYELSRQIGVSPWHWWADVPAEKHSALYVKAGQFSDGEPAVKYRGIFINDEWPCMGEWTTEKLGGFNSKMYVHIYDLLLRLKANFLWPAMWSAAFYADDPENSRLADEMGIIIGTSHHEPMARNHQEYARNRSAYGPWNYRQNPEGIERFFREGIERMKGKEEVVTIAMRGDGDEPIGPDTDTRALEEIVKRQREIIREITGKPAHKTPQIWALYSEVLEYYDQGMKIPDDVMILLCDDNWGNVRRLPDLNGKRHPGGYGMYYHVDLHGAPRAYQWLNMTQIQHMWEQLYLTYTYGVDKMWILNVGDLKPNEFPTDFFLKMAWDPSRFTSKNLIGYTEGFCAQQFGEKQAKEAAHILNLYCKYCARVTAEMLDANTYNLDNGEFKAVTDEFLALEAYALRQYAEIPADRRDAYYELILFPVQAMANLYKMYYAAAMNRKLAKEGDARANAWAERTEYCFSRDARLCSTYNHLLAGGKWNHIMDQTHIGYTSWDEPKEGNIMPAVTRVAENDRLGGYVYEEQGRGVVVMEAERFATSTSGKECDWSVLPDLGRTLSGVTLMPYGRPIEGASVTYRMKLSSDHDRLPVRVILDSTLPFVPGGHSFAISLDGGDERVINFNSELTWANNYSKMYPAGAARIIESKITFTGSPISSGEHTITIRPLGPAIVLHKIIVDCGSDVPSRLNLQESPYQRIK